MKTINQTYDDLDSTHEDNKKIEDIDLDISGIGPLNIYKCLPQTNCQECGEKTCMAFSMKILSGDKFLDDCLQLQEPWHQDQVECLKKTVGVEMMKIMGWEGY
jgi:ArsR family metal-binding transcriptional regulator